MRHDAPLPATPALPLHAARAGLLGDPRDAPVTLEPQAVADFNALLHELHPDAPHVDEDALASVARWLVALPPAQGDAQVAVVGVLQHGEVGRHLQCELPAVLAVRKVGR